MGELMNRLLIGAIKPWLVLRSAILQAFVITAIGALAGCSTFDKHQDVPERMGLPARTFTFEDGGRALFYSFTLGSPSPRDPLIFFISGSGCASVKNRFPAFFNPIEGKLNARVLILQKRGIEEDSTGEHCSQVFRDTDFFPRTVSDQLEFINHHLSSQAKGVNSVVLLGASEGAVVASKIASIDSRITHLALLSGGGSTLRANLELISKKKWYLPAPYRTFSSIESDPGNTSKLAWGHSYKYWSTILDVNIGELLLPLNIPIIAAMGEQDESVPIETVRSLKQRFNSLGKSNFYLHIFPEADHQLRRERDSTEQIRVFLEELILQINGGKSQ